MLTEFGLELRMIRLACGDRILNMAEKLGETPAFISKLERGAIVLPAGFDEKVIAAYQLNRRRADQVRLAFKRTFAKEKMGQIFENATKHEEPVAFCDNSFFEGLEAAEKRIKQVGKTKTLIEQIPDSAWKDWDRRDEDVLVVDNTDEDDE